MPRVITSTPAKAVKNQALDFLFRSRTSNHTVINRDNNNPCFAMPDLTPFCSQAKTTRYNSNQGLTTQANLLKSHGEYVLILDAEGPDSKGNSTKLKQNQSTTMKCFEAKLQEGCISKNITFAGYNDPSVPSRYSELTTTTTTSCLTCWRISK